MHHALIVAALATFAIAPAFAARPTNGSTPCPMQKSREVSYRSATAKDVLEVAIGAGPCADATLTIVVRSDSGRVLYSYSNPFEQHVVRDEKEPLEIEAKRLVDGLIADGVGSTAELPPWLPPEQYEQQHQAAILVPRQRYEDLRTHPRPMLSHLTYFEGWRSVVYDEKTGASLEIVSGGT